VWFLILKFKGEIDMSETIDYLVERSQSAKDMSLFEALKQNQTDLVKQLLDCGGSFRQLDSALLYAIAKENFVVFKLVAQRFEADLNANLDLSNMLSTFDGDADGQVYFNFKEKYKLPSISLSLCFFSNFMNVLGKLEEGYLANKNAKSELSSYLETLNWFLDHKALASEMLGVLLKEFKFSSSVVFSEHSDWANVNQKNAVLAHVAFVLLSRIEKEHFSEVVKDASKGNKNNNVLPVSVLNSAMPSTKTFSPTRL